jgi:hypothetical protein
MNDIHPARTDVSGKAQLIQNTSAAIETAPRRVQVNGNFGAQTLEQWTGAVEASNFHIEHRNVQSVRNVNELPLGTADVEMIQEFQDLNSISIHLHYMLHHINAETA